MSTTSSRHEPAAGSPPNAGMLWLSSWVWTSPVEGSLTTYLVPCGDVSVTRRSPGNSWVIDSDSDSDATIPLPVTGIDDEMPVGSSSGIATGKPAAKNVLLTQLTLSLATVRVTAEIAIAPWLLVAVAWITRPAPSGTVVLSHRAVNGGVASIVLVPSGRSNWTRV